MQSAAPQPARGFTLVEATLSVAVASLILLGALTALGASTRSQVIQVESARAMGLAEALLAEIMGTAYEEPDDAPQFGREGSESAAVRVAWDDVDDYDGWQSPPVTRWGDPIAGADWERSVTVRPVDPVTLDVLDANALDTGVRRIEVTVTDPTGRVTRLFGLRADLKALEQLPILDQAYVSHVQVAVQIDANPASRMTGGTQVLNQRPPAADGGSP